MLLAAVQAMQPCRHRGLQACVPLAAYQNTLAHHDTVCASQSSCITSKKLLTLPAVVVSHGSDGENLWEGRWV